LYQHPFYDVNALYELVCVFKRIYKHSNIYKHHWDRFKD